MKFPQKKFSVPFCIHDEPMPDKAFKLLSYLISISDFGGGCRPGYAAMKRAMRADDKDIGSNHTVNKHLSTLRKLGWIFATKKTNSKTLIWLQIPPKFRSLKAPEKPISVVH